MIGELQSDGAGPETSAAERVALLHEVEPMVRRICRGQLGAVEGDDAAQAALLRVWQTLESGRELDSVRGYAAAMARYAVLNDVRDRNRRPTAAGELAEHVWVDPTPGPYEQVERRDEIAHARERVEALLAQLTPRQESMLRAQVFGERTAADVATEFDVSPHAVGQSKSRAMARMRELSGTHTTHPLALPGTRNGRRREAAREVAAARAEVRPEQSGRGIRLPDEVHEAGLAAAAKGRSATELADEFGVSDSTAKRWRRSVTSDDPLVQAREAVNALTDDAGADPLSCGRWPVADLDAGIEDSEPSRTPQLDDNSVLHDSDDAADGEVVGAA